MTVRKIGACALALTMGVWFSVDASPDGRGERPRATSLLRCASEQPGNQGGDAAFRSAGVSPAFEGSPAKEGSAVPVAGGTPALRNAARSGSDHVNRTNVRRIARNDLVAGWAPLRAVGSQKADAPLVLTSDLDNLNGAWRFGTDPEDRGEALGWHKPDLADATWRVLNVPGGWEEQGITDPRPGMPAKPRVGAVWTDYDGVAWYRKRVTVPREWGGKRLILQLGSVDDGDRTFVNGVLVGETPVSRLQAVLVRRLYRVPPEVVRAGAENVVAIKVSDGGGPGGLMGPDLCLAPEDAVTAPVTLPGRTGALEAQFARPPADTRILKIIHGWPDEPEAQDVLIRTLASQGFGGVVCNVSFQEYLRSEPRWNAFKRAVREARKAGMSMWLYDEKGYPSGSADGLTLEGRPELEARGLLIADAVTSGEPVDITVPPGRAVLAAAVPIEGGRLDIARAEKLTPKDGRIVWQPSGGKWHVMAITEDRLYDGTHASNSFGDRLPYIDLMDPEPTARYLEVTHDAYAKRLGADMGKYFVSTFTDEPSLMSMFLRRMPYRVLPWSPAFAKEFRARRGYEIGDRLPLLVAGAGSAAMKARYDYWKTVGELTAGSFFGQIQRWCAKHNVRSGGHLLFEENLSYHVPLYGDFMACARNLDAPSIDCLTSVPEEVPWHIARLMGSVADLEGRPTTMCETSDFGQTYRAQGDTRPVRRVSEAEIRGTVNRLMLGGINTITSYYTFQGISSAQLRTLNSYVGRCSLMLTGGRQVTDIAVVYPIESVWARFMPSRLMTSECGDAARVERSFKAASDLLYGGGRDFTYLDSAAIVKSRVERGALVHGAMRWKVVVLPCADTLPMAAWKKLEAFVKSGGAVVALSALPANSESQFPSAEVGVIGRRLFGAGSGMRSSRFGAGVGVFMPESSEQMLVHAVDGLIAPDVSAPAPIRATHRRIGENDVYFVANDGPTPWQGKIAVHGRGAGTLWDPMTGKRTAIANPAQVRLSLQPYSGVILRFAGAAARRRLAGTSPLAGMETRALKPVRVVTGGGEHVAGTLREMASPFGGGARAWEVSGTLKKSDVDTFLFAGLQYEPALDLSRDQFMRLRVAVPPGQPTAPQLMVIVTDRRGVQHWLPTGQSLADPGQPEVTAPIRAFTHASFSGGPGGALDWSAVTAISIGWGGHFGKEGERIAFTLEPPLAGRVGARKR